MKIAQLTIQVLVALGLLNVWILRFHRPTPFRGGESKSMPEEFAVYGLPTWVMWTVGAVKVMGAMCLIAGIWVPAVVMPAAAAILVLMLGAIVMHFKVHDPLLKSVPAAVVLALIALVLGNALR